jgi:hypothetical protein
VSIAGNPAGHAPVPVAARPVDTSHPARVTAGDPGIFFLGHGHPVVISSTIN